MGSVSRLSSATSISTLLALMVSCGGGSGPTAIAPPAVTTNATSDPSQDLIDPILDPFLPQGFALSGGADLTQLLMSQTLLSDLKRPYGIAFDGSHLVVAEFGFSLGSSGLRVISPAGDPIGVLAAGQVGRLRGVAIDGSDYLALDGGSGAPGRLFRVPSTGASPQLVAGDLGVAMSIETIGADDYLVTNQEGQLLRIQQGQVSPIAEGLGFIYGVAVEDAQTYLVTDLVEGRLLQVDAGGGVSPLVTEGMGQPRGVTVESPGVYLVSDFGWETGQGRLLRVRPSEMEAVEVIASGIGNPVDAAILDEGVYGVTDFQSNRVLLIDEESVAQQPSPSPEPSSAPGSPPPLLPTRPGPYPSPEVEGVLEVNQGGGLPGCEPGIYPVTAEFDAGFDELMFLDLGGSEPCFKNGQFSLRAPDLVDGSSDLFSSNDIPEGYSLRFRLIEQVYGGFSSLIYYHEPERLMEGVQIRFQLNAKNITVPAGEERLLQLEGPPDALATDVMPEFNGAAHEVVIDPETKFSLTTATADIHPKATVSDVNAVLNSIGGAITYANPGGRFIVINFPNAGGFDGLERIEDAVLRSGAFIFFGKQDLGRELSTPKLDFNTLPLPQMNRLGAQSASLLAPETSPDLPVQFIAQRAFDLRSKEPVSIYNSPSQFELISIDSWGCDGSLDLLPVSFTLGCVEDDNNPLHGIRVAGMAIAKYDNPELGLMTGMFVGNDPVQMQSFDLNSMAISVGSRNGYAQALELIEYASQQTRGSVNLYEIPYVNGTVGAPSTDLQALEEAYEARRLMRESGAIDKGVFVAIAGNAGERGDVPDASTILSGSAFTSAALIPRSQLEQYYVQELGQDIAEGKCNIELQQSYSNGMPQSPNDLLLCLSQNSQYFLPDNPAVLEPLPNVIVAVNASLEQPGTYAPTSSRGSQADANDTVAAVAQVNIVDRDFFGEQYEIDVGCEEGFAALGRGTDAAGNAQTVCGRDGGTSLAAPQIGGLALMVWNRNPSLTPADVVQQIKDTVSEYPVLSSSGRFICDDEGKLLLSQVKAINFAKALDLEEPPIQICDLEFAEFTLPEQTSTDSGQLRLQTRLLWDNGDQAYDNQTQPPILLTLEVENGTLDATDLDPSQPGIQVETDGDGVFESTATIDDQQTYMIVTASAEYVPGGQPDAAPLTAGPEDRRMDRVGSPTPTPSPVSNPGGGDGQYIACSGCSSGNVLGDPHLYTFDRLRYDFHGVGEYILTQSLISDFELQARFRAFGGSTVASMTSALALQMGSHRLMVSVDPQPQLILDGQLLDLQVGDDLALGSNSEYSIVFDDFTGDGDPAYEISGPFGSVQVQPYFTSSPSLAHLAVNIELEDESLQLNLRGLLGNHDGDSGNDLQTRDGIPISPLDYGQLYPLFGNSWRVTPSESLFYYAPGEDTETFTDRAFPSEIVQLSPQRRADAESICLNSGARFLDIEDCIFDVAVMGSTAVLVYEGQINFVNTVEDEDGTDPAECSLREAIIANNMGADFGGCQDPEGVIRFDPTLIGGTIMLSGSGLPLLESDVRIEVPGNSALEVNGASQFRVFDIGSGVSVEIEGLTITNGRVPFNGPLLDRDGGGIRNVGGTLTLTNSTISDSFSSSKGGGIYNSDSGSVSLNNSILSGNSAAFGSSGLGGGIFNSGSISLNNSTLSGNSASADGGGIYNHGSGNISLNNSTLFGNSARSGGGIYNRDLGSISLNNSTLSGNSASDDGGGIYNRDLGSISLNNNTLFGNSARSGGGIYNRDSGNISLNNSTLSGNSAGNNGGGIYNHDSGNISLNNSTLSSNSTRNDGGGISNSNSGNVNLNHSTLTSNSARRGGGLSNRDRGSTFSLNNSTLSDNSAGTNGGGIYNSSYGSVSLNNSTLSGNSATNGGGIHNSGSSFNNGGSVNLNNSTVASNFASAASGGGIFTSTGSVSLVSTMVADNLSGGGNSDLSFITGTIAARFSLIENGTLTIDQGNNLFGVDPLLAPLADNGGMVVGNADTATVIQTQALQAGSPAINAGSNPEGLTTDQRGPGFLRVSGGQTDIGAFERQ